MQPVGQCDLYSYFSDFQLNFFFIKHILVLFARCNSGEPHCPAKAVIKFL